MLGIGMMLNLSIVVSLSKYDEHANVARYVTDRCLPLISFMLFQGALSEVS
jgi:hypothetical protein